MTRRPHRAIEKCTGFSLLEVLVASTLFSLGMAGLSGLLLTNLTSSKQSRNFSIATIAATNLAEQMRFNPASLDRYLNPPTSISANCLSTGSVVCTPQQQADYDFAMWQQDLMAQLPHSAVTVCMDSSPDDGDVLDNQCDGGGTVVIKLFWATPSGDGNPGIEKHRYSLVAG